MTPFDEKYPNISLWVQDGWIEIGRDGFSASFIRVLDTGGLVWEGEKTYQTVADALADAEAAIGRLDEMGW